MQGMNKKLLLVLTTCVYLAGCGGAGSNNTATNNTETANNSPDATQTDNSSAQTASTSSTTSYTPTFGNVNVGIATSQDNKASTLYYGNIPFATNPTGTPYIGVQSAKDTWVTSTISVDRQIISATILGIRYGDISPFLGTPLSTPFSWNSEYINPSQLSSNQPSMLIESTAYNLLISPLVSSMWVSPPKVLVNNVYIVAGNAESGSIAILNSNDTNSQTIAASWNVFAASSGGAYFESGYTTAPLAVYTPESGESANVTNTDYLYTAALRPYPSSVPGIFCAVNNGVKSSSLELCSNGLPNSNKYAITAMTVSGNLLYVMYQNGALYVANLATTPTNLYFTQIKNTGSSGVLFAVCPVTKNTSTYPYGAALNPNNVMITANRIYITSTKQIINNGIFLCGKNLNGSTLKNKNEVYSILPTDTTYKKFDIYKMYMDDDYSGTDNNLIGITTDGTNVYAQIEHSEGEQFSYRLLTLQNPQPYFGTAKYIYTSYFTKNTLENNIFPLGNPTLGYEPYQMTSLTGLQTGGIVADFFVPNENSSLTPSSYVLSNQNLSNPLSPWISPTGDFRIPNNESAVLTIFTTYTFGHSQSSINLCQITLATDIYGQNWQAYGFPLDPSKTTSCPLVYEQFNRWLPVTVFPFNKNKSSALGTIKQVQLTSDSLYLINSDNTLYKNLIYTGGAWLSKWGGSSDNSVTQLSGFNNSSSFFIIGTSDSSPLSVFIMDSTNKPPKIVNFPTPLPTPLPTPAQMQVVNTSRTSNIGSDQQLVMTDTTGNTWVLPNDNSYKFVPGPQIESVESASVVNYSCGIDFRATPTPPLEYSATPVGRPAPTPQRPFVFFLSEHTDEPPYMVGLGYNQGQDDQLVLHITNVPNNLLIAGPISNTLLLIYDSANNQATLMDLYPTLSNVPQGAEYYSVDYEALANPQQPSNNILGQWNVTPDIMDIHLSDAQELNLVNNLLNAGYAQNSIQTVIMPTITAYFSLDVPVAVLINTLVDEEPEQYHSPFHICGTETGSWQN